MGDLYDTTYLGKWTTIKNGMYYVMSSDGRWHPAIKYVNDVHVEPPEVIPTEDEVRQFLEIK